MQRVSLRRVFHRAALDTAEYSSHGQDARATSAARCGPLVLLRPTFLADELDESAGAEFANVQIIAALGYADQHLFVFGTIRQHRHATFFQLREQQLPR